MIELLDGYLHGFKVKYMDLDKLLADIIGPNATKKNKLDTVNVFINMESLYNSFRNRGIEKIIKQYTKDDLRYICRQLVAGIINVAAHYRKYFAYHKIKTSIVYYYNEIDDERTPYNNCAVIENYRHHFFDSLHSIDRWTINGMVKDMIPIVKTICNYLENIYVISADRVESSLIPYFIFMEGILPSNMNIFVTKDEYDLQYANHRSLIVTKYNDTPILLSSRNIIRYLVWKHDIKTDKLIDPLLINFIIACVGNRKRSLKGIKGVGWTSIYKELLKLYEVGYIIPDEIETMHVRYLSEVLTDESFRNASKQDLLEQIADNYKCVDVTWQYEDITDVQKDKLKNQFIDKIDTKSLIELNNRFFDDTPIQLFELNQYEPKNDWENIAENRKVFENND